MSTKNPSRDVGTVFTQPCHYAISYLCALELATSVPRTLGIDDSFARCLRYRLTVARIFSLKFLLFSFLVLAESIVITIIIIIIKFYH